ncbi:MAG TPA: sigma-54 dependent transcriptional regulator [Gemmatimonadales bacterium]|nr:sigma-54 dependent transcriptional regulator [Gemmatimonadales bacterium]
MADTLLLVDDDPDVLRSVGAFLERSGWTVFREDTGEAAITAFQRERPDVVVLDLWLPDLSGLDVLERLREWNAAVVLLTGHADVPTAVQAMQLGAENFLTKPVDMPHLVATVTRAAETARLRREVRRLTASDRPGAGAVALGVSPPMRELERQVALLAEAERTTVLITGESGTGKGRVARMLHAGSPRAAAPFVEVNSGGLTATFLANELFGHERGAFTDAKDTKRGLFEIADRGTLFLDEIGELGLELQPKLLGVIETKRFRRLGGTREIGVDVRLLAATNRDLVQLVNDGAFREDLYYRINVTVIHLPPLRERARDDRLALVEQLMAELAGEVPGAPAEVGTEALDRLLSYAWPGNVREMRNALERGMIMARGAPALGLEHLPTEIRRGRGGVRRHKAETLKDAERRQIERALKFHGGNRTHAARELGISRVTLLKKIRDYGLET